MRERFQVAAVLLLIAVSLARPGAERVLPVFRQQYAMGTMFEIIAYHASPEEAARAVDLAMAEIVRLDDAMSHFKADSELSQLNQQARNGPLRVSASLYDVVGQSLDVSRRSRGRFDPTVAPLLQTWQVAHDERRQPSRAEIAAARQCVGYDKVELDPPDRIRFRSDCLRLDLGGIGKGYAVDRALAILAPAGVRHALVNAGRSSIAAIGHPPGRAGFPVALPVAIEGRTTLLLSNASLSTSGPVELLRGGPDDSAGTIIDPLTGFAIEVQRGVSVVAPSATISDALSTALLILGPAEAASMLREYREIAAVWFAPDGTLANVYGASRLDLAEDN